MLRGYSFRPRLWGLALAAMACAGFIALGNWQSRRADEKRALVDVRTPRRLRRIEAIALERLSHALEVGGAAKGSVRQNLGIAEFAAETGLRFVPIVIEQHSPAEDGLEREWPRADLGTERNEAYALQWYAFAALALVLGVVLSFRRVAAR